MRASPSAPSSIRVNPVEPRSAESAPKTPVIAHQPASQYLQFGRSTALDHLAPTGSGALLAARPIASANNAASNLRARAAAPAAAMTTGAATPHTSGKPVTRPSTMLATGP